MSGLMPGATIDLRSDTVTRPTDEMRRAMAAAEVGDDVYGEDPTVNRLQELTARRLGFEAALWVPSGVMGNEIAIRLLTRPGEEVLAEERSHVVQFELAGMAVLSGVLPRAVPAPDGLLTPEIVRAAIPPRAYYRSDVGLAVLENTHNLAGGTVYTVERMRAVVAACREAGLKVHLDGARLWNAAVALGVPPAELATGADTVMVTLSKGLCAPAGSLLLGSAPRVEEARRVRKQLGGGMRQVGVLAAAGIVAMETMVERLAEDHAHARLLADALARCRGTRPAPTSTNIVVAELDAPRAEEVVALLRGRGVLASALGKATLRLVTHRDVTREACERAAGMLVSVLGEK
jgi:threonine aldolase